MNTALYVIAGLVALAAIYLVLVPSVRVYLRFRGKRVVTCPETREPAGVEVDAGDAAFSLFGDPELRLKDCTRWPEREACGQECLSQIEAAPEDCLVRNILTKWYAGKSCVVCGKPLGEIDWIEHRPALMSPDNVTVEWKDLSPDKVPHALESHRPICWNCHISATFHREHPELIVERPWKKAGSTSTQ